MIIIDLAAHICQSFHPGPLPAGKQGMPVKSVFMPKIAIADRGYK